MCLGKTVFTTCLWSLRSSFYILTWRGTSLLIHSATFLLITLKGYNFIIDFTIHLNWSKNSYYRANTLNCKLSERSYAECFAFIDTILNLGKLVGFILFFSLGSRRVLPKSLGLRGKKSKGEDYCKERLKWHFLDFLIFYNFHCLTF